MVFGKILTKIIRNLVLKNLNNFKYLTFIPARSGSVGVKNKNILKLGNKKLVEFTFKFIQDLNLEKNYIHLSTDSNIYQNIAKKNNINCEFLRSKKISGSKSKIEDAIFEFLDNSIKLYLGNISEYLDIKNLDTLLKNQNSNTNNFKMAKKNKNLKNNSFKKVSISKNFINVSNFNHFIHGLKIKSYEFNLYKGQKKKNLFFLQ